MAKRASTRANSLSAIAGLRESSRNGFVSSAGPGWNRKRGQ